MRILKNDKKLKEYINEKELYKYMDIDIYAISEIISYDKNEMIIESGNNSKYLLFLIKGEIIISSPNQSGKDSCIRYYKDSSLIGEAASLWNLIPTRNVKAISNCIFVGINLEKHREKLLNDLLFLRNITKILTKKINYDNNLSNTLSSSLEMRLADFIITHSTEGIFDFKLTLCSEILNTSYRHLLRTVKIFTDLNILKKTNRKYKIMDLEKLVEIKHGVLKV